MKELVDGSALNHGSYCEVKNLELCRLWKVSKYGYRNMNTTT